MLVKKNKPHSKINPKKQKRQRIVNLGQPKFSLQVSPTVVEHEKLSDWVDAS